MLGVTSVAVRDAALPTWVPEDVDESVVIAGGNHRLCLVHVDTVDVRTIRFSREDAVDEPPELAVLTSPHRAGGVRSSGGILVAGRNEEEEKLVGVAHRSDVRGIATPVYASERGIVRLAFSD